ncbi:hypothetical protein [Micromonospora halophytica]|uniref:Uncharacterized protein n=1 Tax=Micromonospora halophytica TaxID=47864 RepID=A0A1C5IZ99_9ACTN|nr:hypothetical protein [Micromonospora halophytica]SCG63269.1 hypothetical protein GA0070560_11856 [Micromonospora halophytica]
MSEGPTSTPPATTPVSPPALPTEVPSGTQPPPDRPVPSAGRPTPLSATELPTLPPTPTLPKTPTDSRRTDVLAGRIVRGGSGPCYGLVTDDGREYALYGVGMGSYGTETTVKVTISSAVPRIDCGPGIPASIVKISPVG